MYKQPYVHEEVKVLHIVLLMLYDTDMFSF